jgi:hypothetical protein
VDVISHVSNVQIDTACAAAMHALLSAKDQYRIARAKEFQVQPHTLRQIFDEEVGLFDILHQDRGVGTLRDHLVSVFNRQRGRFRYLLYSEEIEQQMRSTPSETDYYRAGPPAVTNRNSSVPLDEVATIPTFPAFGGVQTVLVKTDYTNVLLPNGSIGMLQRLVQIGEYYLMRHQPNSSPEKDFRSNNIKIYNGQENCYTMIDFMDAVDRTEMFDADGRPRPINDGIFDMNAVTVGNISDVIWDSTGIPRSTHSQIPVEHLPHGYVNQFANTLAKLFETRRIAAQQYENLEKLISQTIARANATFTPTKVAQTIPGKLGDIIQFQDAATKAQGVSFDDLEAGDKNVLESMATQIISFFPNNILLGNDSAPLWSSARSSGAALWENLIVPYYPPVLVSQKGGVANAQVLSQLSFNQNQAKNSDALKLAVTVWALKGGKTDAYKAEMMLLSGEKNITDSVSKFVADSNLLQTATKTVAQAVQALNPQQKANFDRLFDIYELLENNQGDAYNFSTSRRTPGFQFPTGAVEIWYFAESNPMVPLLPRQPISSALHPQINAFAVNESLKHHLLAAQSDVADNRMRKRPIGIIGEIYTQTSHLQGEVRQLLGAKRVYASDGQLLLVDGPRELHTLHGVGLSLRGLFAQLFLGEMIHRGSWSRWASEGLPMPVSIMIARPTITVLTASVVACYGGPDDGGVYYKPSAQRSGTHVRGDVTAQVAFEMSAVVKRDENVYTLNDALVLNVLRGHNTKFFSVKGFQAGPTAWFSGNDASLLAFVVPAAMECGAMISLTGSFDHRGVHNYTDFRYIQSDGGFVGADRANALFNFRRIAEMRRTNAEENSEAYNVNVLCFPGQTWYFNAATQQFSIMSPGSGHFGNTDTIDACKTRKRLRTLYPPTPICV